MGQAGSEELIRSDSWCPYGLKNPWQGQGWSPSRCKWRCIPFRISHEHSDAPALQPQLPRCTMYKNTGVYYAQNDLYLYNKYVLPWPRVALRSACAALRVWK